MVWIAFWDKKGSVKTLGPGLAYMLVVAAKTNVSYVGSIVRFIVVMIVVIVIVVVALIILADVTELTDMCR